MLDGAGALEYNKTMGNYTDSGENKLNFRYIEQAGVYEGFCLVKAVNIKKTSKGSTFLDLILADRSGELGAKLWDYREEIHGVIAVNDLIKVRGPISPFNGEDQMRVDRIRKATEEDGLRLEDFIPCAPESGERMLAEIKKVIASFRDEGLKELVGTILLEHEERLLFYPAAFKLHHAVRGGLLYHTLSILRMAQMVCAQYPFVDADLLYSGVILHDIGKVYEFDADGTGIAEKYTLEGNLVGHIPRGAGIVHHTAQRLGTDRETALLLEHMILSHHGTPEYGAVQYPAFLEAEILSELDMLDARIYEISHAVTAIPKGEFTQRQWALDNRRLYNHGRAVLPPEAKLTEE